MPREPGVVVHGVYNLNIQINEKLYGKMASGEDADMTPMSILVF